MDNKYLIDGEHLVSRFPHVTKVRPTSAADTSHHCYLTLVFHDHIYIYIFNFSKTTAEMIKDIQNTRDA